MSYTPGFFRARRAALHQANSSPAEKGPGGDQRLALIRAALLHANRLKPRDWR